MKFIEHTRNGNEVRIVVWGDHWPSCDKCREVKLDKSASFALACAQGSPLLMEELTKRQAPVEREKTKEFAERVSKYIPSKASKEMLSKVMKYK